MKIEFTKMHGLGNDMIVIDSLDSGYTPTSEQAVKMCDRRFGIGADQILVLLPSETDDFRMKILNADGSEVEMCGNGIRCLMKYIRDRGISDRDELAIETLAGTIKPSTDGDMVRVDMGKPIFDADKVPVRGEGKMKEAPLEVAGETFIMSALSMGNPHCVIKVDDVDMVPLEKIGPEIEFHPWFPNRTNVEFVQILSRDHIKVRVWERGSGATLACGTGACASAVAMAERDLADRKVTVSLPGGDLLIEWNEDSGRVFMTGPAEHVYEGVIELN